MAVSCRLASWSWILVTKLGLKMKCFLSVLARLTAVRVNVFDWRDRVNWPDTIQNIVRL